MFPCYCDFYTRFNYYKEKGIEPHCRIGDSFCWMDPNPNNSKDPEFVAREREFTIPIRFLSVFPTREQYIREIFAYGVRGRYAELMADRMFRVIENE